MDKCKYCKKEIIFYIFFFILISAVLFAISVPVYIEFNERAGATDVCVQIHKEGYEVFSPQNLL